MGMFLLFLTLHRLTCGSPRSVHRGSDCPALSCCSGGSTELSFPNKPDCPVHRHSRVWLKALALSGLQGNIVLFDLYYSWDGREDLCSTAGLCCMSDLSSAHGPSLLGASASSHLVPWGQGFVVECSHVTEFQGANNVKLNVKPMMVLEDQFFPSLIIAFWIFKVFSYNLGKELQYINAEQLGEMPLVTKGRSRVSGW